MDTQNSTQKEFIYKSKRNSSCDLSDLKRRFKDIIEGEIEQLDETWRHGKHLAKEKVDQFVNSAYTKKENAEKIVLKALDDVWNVCHLKELPNWLQDNDYLIFGHRPPLGSFKECLKSVFRLHTQTWNIWTHLIGCIIFIILSGIMFKTSMQTIDKFMIGIYLASAIICLGCSSFYHIFSCHSHSVGNLFCRLDYCGISILITGSLFPCIYYGFYCDYFPKIFYTTLIIFLSIITLFVSLIEKFNHPHLTTLRAGVFFSFGISGVLPFVHWLIAQDWFSVSNLRFSIICILMMAVLYTIGAVLYAMRIPERFKPGMFDYHLHSHQLFHICVVAGAIVHLQGIYGMATHRLENICETDPSYSWKNDNSEKMSYAFSLYDTFLK